MSIEYDYQTLSKLHKKRTKDTKGFNDLRTDRN